MASSDDNLMTMMIEQPWPFRTTLADTFFAKENEALTQALYRTISDDSPALSHESDSTAAFFHIPIPEKNGKAVGGPTGRVAKKRKSRASKRQTTTFIAADPANFREMVQQVTGVRFGLGAADLAGGSASFVQPWQAGPVDLDSLCTFPTLESSKVQFSFS